MTEKKTNGSIVAIITMMFLYAMISFVTNLAAPIGVIWKGAFEGSNAVGMLGNAMNFLAYLFTCRNWYWFCWCLSSIHIWLSSWHRRICSIPAWRIHCRILCMYAQHRCQPNA